MGHATSTAFLAAIAVIQLAWLAALAYGLVWLIS
jgi:hypothetical protein